MNNNISIIIPTYERPAYLKRALEYWSIYPIDLIVVDGSSQPTVEKDLIDSYKNVQYFNLPISVEKRLMFATERLRTPYAAIISDDEFLSYSALLAAANILDSESEVSAVLGSTIGFSLYQNRLIAQLHYESAHQLDISAKIPKKRLEQRLNVLSNSIFYPLVRTEVLQLAGKFLGEHQYTCPYIAEYQMEAILCAAGAVKVMPRLMWLRSFEGNMVSTENHDRTIFLCPWSKDPRNVDELNELIASASKFLSLASSASPSITGLEFVAMYSENDQQSLALQENNRKISMMRKYYAKLPSSFRKLVRSGFYYLFGKTPEGLLPISLVLKKLTSLNIDFDKDEVSRIERLVERNFVVIKK